MVYFNIPIGTKLHLWFASDWWDTEPVKTRDYCSGHYLFHPNSDTEQIEHRETAGSDIVQLERTKPVRDYKAMCAGDATDQNLDATVVSKRRTALALDNCNVCRRSPCSTTCRRQVASQSINTGIQARAVWYTCRVHKAATR